MKGAGEIHQPSGPLHLPFLGLRLRSPLRLACRPPCPLIFRHLSPLQRSHVLQPWPSGTRSPFQPPPTAMILKQVCSSSRSCKLQEHRCLVCWGSAEPSLITWICIPQPIFPRKEQQERSCLLEIAGRLISRVAS